MKNIIRKLRGKDQQQAAAPSFSSLGDFFWSRLNRSHHGTNGESSNKNKKNPVEEEDEDQVQLAMALSVAEKTEAAELIAYRYWAYHILDYQDKIVDGFYDVYGVVYQPDFPDKMPKLVDLQAEQVSSSSICSEVVLVNRFLDPQLSRLEQRALVLLSECQAAGQDVVDPVVTGLARRIAVLVSEQMGGPVSSHADMLSVWKTTSWELKSSLHSNVIPIGQLPIGLARHRALLYKVLADCIGIPCRLVKGKQFTGADDGAVNIVKDVHNREYVVDLIKDPGTLTPSDVSPTCTTDLIKDPDTLTPSDVPPSCSTDVTLGRRHHSEPEGLRQVLAAKPTTERRVSLHLRSPSWTEGLGSPAAVRQMKANDMSECVMEAAKVNPNLAQKLQNVFSESGPDLFREISPRKQSEGGQHLIKPPPKDKGKPPPSPRPPASDTDRLPRLQSVEGLGERRPLEATAASTCPAVSAAAAALALNAAVHDKHSPVAASAITAAVVASSMVVAAAKMDNSADPIPLTAATAAAVAAATLKSDSESDNSDKTGSGHKIESDKPEDKTGSRSDSRLQDVAEWEIPWEDLVIGDRIGLGSYGEVYRGDWHGTEVAVKKFLDQDISGDALEEFITEVRLMKRMRHPNVVLFMGAVTRPPHLSIVSEFLPRGSLYKLLHRPQCQVDERRRLRMALDVAKGMNYLHNSNPMIVHRDLKSPNLLVDKNWVVKVCDFGLSRMKHHTFLSSNSQAGTPEWMAPEVLRNEPSNEKADVYSFGVILWELATLQKPWHGLNPMQVVGAVGFQHRRLDIPQSVDADIAKIIQECWHNEPNLRPSFAEIMVALKPLRTVLTWRDGG